MKAIRRLAILGLLFATATPCSAMRSIGIVSKEQAKVMGIEIRATPAGPEAAWVELEFKPEGKLKNFHHVEIEINEGEKSLLGWCPLREERLGSGRVLVRFMAGRAFIQKIALSIVLGAAQDEAEMLSLKEFVDLDKIR
jgi:hypothetical protein